jgi:UDP-2-acetamido-3-amino-2,3-dideoxy-glucuronate N-acetyltransferase
MEQDIHKTAIIDKGALIGNGTKVWHWTHICSGASIGKECTLGQNVFVGNKVIIGNNVKIQNNVSVYDNVTLKDNVFCGPSVVFTNVYNPRSKVSRKNEFKDTLIEEGATLGANCTIVCGVKVGEYAFVGAGSVVTTNIDDYALVVGVPAKQIGWVSADGERLELPVESENKTIKAKCIKTGDTYNLKGNKVTKVVMK